MTNKGYALELGRLDKNVAEKIEKIDIQLSVLEFGFAQHICKLADSVDLDRRIALCLSLQALEELYGQGIMML